jgi:hypothetical protein
MINLFKKEPLLIALLIVGLLIRVIPIFTNSISFHYDMTRDAFIAEQIYKHHDLKVLGPPTSKEGLYHGVLYYYLIAPFYALGDGDPRVPSFILGILNILAIIPLYLLAKEILKSQKLGLLAAFLFTFSFEATQYSIWLSDPGPAVLTTILFWLGLMLWGKGNKWGFILSAISTAMSAQFEFFLIYLFVVMFFYKFIFKAPLYKRDIIAGVFAALFALSTMIVAIVKFNALNKTITAFQTLGESKATLDANFTDLFINYINKSSLVFTNNFFPVNVFIGGLLMFVVLFVIFKDKQKFILFGLLSSIFIFLFGGHSNIYSNIGILAPVFLAVSFLIGKIYKQNNTWAYTLVAIIFAANIYTIIRSIPKGQYLLVIPKDMILSNQLALIDKSYEIAQGKPFSINSLTVPLFTNTSWAYLYHYYGEKNYGYVPSIYGRDPIGTLGENVIKKTEKPEETLFFIIEPLRGIPGNITDSEFEYENSRTSLKKEYNFGEIRLQFRSLKNATSEAQIKKAD